MTSPRLYRPILAGLLAAGLLTGLGAGAVLAKCEHTDPNQPLPEFCQQVLPSFTVPGGTVQPGEPFPAGTFRADTPTVVGVYLSRSEHAYLARSVSILFSRVADGTSLLVTGEPTGADGSWTLRVTLPANGTWTGLLTVIGSGEEQSVQPLGAVQVRPPLVPPANAPSTPVTPTAPGSGFPWAWLGVGLAVIATAAGAAIARVRGARSRTRQAPQPGGAA